MGFINFGASILYALISSANPSINYNLTFVGNAYGGDSSLIFSTALNNSQHILTDNTSNEECLNQCSNLNNCMGVVNFRGNGCVTLDNLGEPVQTNITSLSFTKYTSYDLRDTHTVSGFYWYANSEYAEEKNHTLYIDLNHNGEHDQGEPINTTINDDFMFTNISAGNYLVRELSNDNCIQLWPGAWGDNVISVDGSTNYVDSVVQYYHDGHPTQGQFSGGFILDDVNFTPVVNASTSLILGDSTESFLSFKPGYGIVLAFLDEVIENTPGNDITIEVFGESTVNAHVSISHNNIDYITIGTLENNSTSFDLGENHTDIVAFVKLDFFNTAEVDNGETRNIISVRGETATTSYSPPFAAYVSVPQDDTIVFVKDCHYYYSCYTYCIYSRVTLDTMDSCMVGCDLWEETGTCDCINYENADVPFYGEIFRPQECQDGCSYKIQHEVYPDYIVKMNASGRPSHITSAVNCEEYDVSGLSPNGCIMDKIDSCGRQPSCQAISMDNHVHGYLYDDHHYVDEVNSYFLVKRNSSLMRFTTPTTSMTTTLTTSPTSSLSSTGTTTYTSTFTTTMTITPTSSVTSTATSSVTSTATSSVTSTATSSVTSTATSSVTSTATSTVTSTVTTVQPVIESSSSTAVRDGVLITLAVILIIGLAGFLFVSHRRNKLKRESAANNNTSDPYVNPIYDTTYGNAPPSPQHNTFMSNGNPPSEYLDVAPDTYIEHEADYMEEPDVESSNYITVTTVEEQSNV